MEVYENPAAILAYLLGFDAFRELLLRQGASLQTIGDILRHTSIETSAHYAKVDIALLQQVARPWPEGALC
jgi:site-specific recombinase XerD